MKNPIWLPLQNEYHKRHQNVVQLVYWKKWVPMHGPKTIFQNDFLASLGHFIKGLRRCQWKNIPWELAYFQDGRHTHCQNANCHNSVTSQLIFIILVSKVWFSVMLNPFQEFKNNSIIQKGPKKRDGHQSRVKIMHNSLSSDMQFLNLF